MKELRITIENVKSLDDLKERISKLDESDWDALISADWAGLHDAGIDMEIIEE